MSSKIYQTLMAMSLMAMTMNSGNSGRYVDELTPQERAELEAIRKESRRKLLLKRGMKEWHIDGFGVLALNEKNAKRKVENIKKQLNP